MLLSPLSSLLSSPLNNGYFEKANIENVSFFFCAKTENESAEKNLALRCPLTRISSSSRIKSLDSNRFSSSSTSSPPSLLPMVILCVYGIRRKRKTIFVNIKWEAFFVSPPIRCFFFEKSIAEFGGGWPFSFSRILF